MVKKIYFLSIFLFLLLIFSGCSLSFKTGGTQKSSGGPDGGVFMSVKKGESWTPMSLVPTIKGAPESIAGLNAVSLIVDPSDSDTLYFATENGLFYTHNITNGWNRVGALGNVKIAAVSVSAKDKCLIYTAAANRVYRSDDCSRTWSQVYFDNNTQTAITSVVADHYDGNRVYIGTSRGEMIKSSDKGKSWQTILRAESAVLKIILSSSDSRTIFASTEKKGIFRSVDGGDSWLSLADNMKEFKNSTRIRDMATAVDKEGFILVATTYGILRSEDNGSTWSRIELLTPESETTINALAVNPKNSSEIYYVTNTAFYSSFDGGGSWTVGKLPTGRAGQTLLVNPDKNNILYLGVKAIKK